MKTKLNEKGLAELKCFEAKYADAINGAIGLFKVAIVVAEKHIYCRSTFNEYIAIFETHIEQLNSGQYKQKAPSRYEMAKWLLASASRIQKNWDKTKQKEDKDGNTRTDQDILPRVRTGSRRDRETCRGGGRGGAARMDMGVHTTH